MSIEKAIAAALEPFADVIARIDARLKALEVPKSIEVPIDDVAKALKADAEFLELARGEPGKPGVTPEIDSTIEKAVAAALEPNADVFARIDERLKMLELPANIEVPIDDVAKALKADAEFLELARGEPGKPGLIPEIDYTKVLDEIPKPKDGTNGIGVNVKAWLPGVYREGDVVQHDLGRIARAKRDTAEQPGAGSDWERIGSGGFRWCGVKDDSRTYEHGDFYIDDGTTFLMVDEKPRMFCRKGRDAKTPENGKDGKDTTALIGELKIWPGIDAPDGYLLADGAPVPDGDEYKALRAIVGDTVPDMSSEFLISETPAGPAVVTFIIRAYVS